MRLENTIYSNYKVVVDEFDIPVALQIDGKIKYRLYDDVSVKGDYRGYIGEGITREGFGKVIRIRRDNTDSFVGVLMDNGEFGFVKASRLTKFPN